MKIYTLQKTSKHNIHIFFGIIKLKFKSRYEKPVLKYIETHIVDHCNLNCKACCHYCNVTSPNFIKIQDFEKDFKELSSKFEIEQIRLMGGGTIIA